MKRTVVTSTFIAAILLLAGCSAAGSSESPTVTADDASLPEGERFGDVVCFEQITDSFGEYCHTTIAPDAEALVFDVSKVDEAKLTEFGFTLADAEAALPSALRLFTEEVLDGSRLDNYEQSDAEWFAENDDLMEAESAAFFLSYMQEPGSLLNYGQTVTDVLPQPILRNGSARAEGSYIEVTKIDAEIPGEGVANLVIHFASTSEYLATDAQILSAMVTVDASRTEASLRESNPELFDGLDEGLILVDASGLLSYGKGDNEKAIGRSFVLTFTTDTGAVIRE
jgi:hypothetical protein